MPSQEKNTNQTLELSRESFFKTLPLLIASGVTFDAKESNDSRCVIVIKFTGGY